MPVVIRRSVPGDDPILTDHFIRMWQDIGKPKEAFRPDPHAITQAFIDQARTDHAYQGFLADVDGVVVGSAGCQLFAGLYPNVLAQTERLYGYIWGVYVEASHRRLGIATRLTQATMAYLKDLGCTRVLLHASPDGRPVYAALGYAPSNEMFLEL